MLWETPTRNSFYNVLHRSEQHRNAEKSNDIPARGLLEIVESTFVSWLGAYNAVDIPPSTHAQLQSTLQLYSRGCLLDLLKRAGMDWPFLVILSYGRCSSKSCSYHVGGFEASSYYVIFNC